MRDTMYQESILSAIDNIDREELFAEYSVLTALGESYVKSAMMFQEASTDEDAGTKSFTGQPIDPFATTADATQYPLTTIPGQTVKDHSANGEKWYQKLWRWIKTTLGKIGKFFKELPGKIIKFIKSIPSKIKGAPKAFKMKTGQVVSLIKDKASLKYIGEAIDYKGDPDESMEALDRLADPSNYELTIYLNPDYANEVLAGIAKANENIDADRFEKITAAIKDYKPNFKKSFAKTTMNLSEFNTKSIDLGTACINMQKVCDDAIKDGFRPNTGDPKTDAKVQKFMEKSFSDTAKTLNDLSAFIASLLERSAVPATLFADYINKNWTNPSYKAIVKGAK